jgi:tripartite ATP-independent transporter DctM subunit
MSVHGDTATTTQPPSSEAAHRSPLHVVTQGVDRFLGYATDLTGALLVLTEVVVLLWGVISRYVLHQPLVWSDELASMLFLWLAMIGSVIAFRRSGHMRMTAMVDRFSEPRRALFDLVAVVASGAFLLIVVEPSFEFAREEVVMTMTTLGISNVWRAAALPVGVGLMLLVTLLRVLETANLRQLLIAVAIVGTIVGVLFAAETTLRALGNWNLVIYFILLLFALVFAGVPIAFSFGLATLAYLVFSTTTPTIIVIGRMEEGMSHMIMLAVPLFVFLGMLLEFTGMAKAMVRFLASLLGHFRGGLDYVLIGAMYLVSGISGSKAADMAAVAPVLIPEMRERGAKDGEMLALLAATGAQTETIPPSIVLITIGSVCSVSIAALFTGGLVPGLVCALLLASVVWWRNKKADLARTEREKWSAVGRALLVAAPALALPFVIRAAVVEGVATATEVSTIGIAYAVLVGMVVYRKLPLKKIFPALVDTASLSGTILLIIGTASAMAWALTQSGFSRDLAQMMAALPGGAPAFLAVSIVIFIVLGSVLEGIPAIVVFGPLLFPIAKQFGVNEVHYSMVVILSMGIGLFSPPFGVGYYGACATTGIHPNKGMKPIAGYMAALLLGTILVAAIPWLSTGFL